MQARLRAGLTVALLLALAPFATGQEAPDAPAAAGQIAPAAHEEAAPAASGQASAQAEVQPIQVRYIEKELRIPTTRSFPQGLDAVEIYADLPGRHPLAVLTHGTSNNEEERRRVTPWSQQGQALWFARRGYVAIVVVRSGYGRSGGDEDSRQGGCHSSVGGGFERAGEASVEDLRGVMTSAAKFPEVDASTIVSVGISTGGFAQVALSADPPKGLKAAISFAGGRGSDGHEHNCDLQGLINAFGSFGKRAHKHGDLPMLWVYAENDHYFPPAMATQFDAAYVKSGATAEFVMAPADGDDGHHLYGNIPAWSDTVNTFLSAHNLLPNGSQVLPPPQPPNVPTPPGLGEQGKQAWERFLVAGPFRAFATDGSTAYGTASGAFDQSLADGQAMERCGKAAAAGRRCAIVARTPGQ